MPWGWLTLIVWLKQQKISELFKETLIVWLKQQKISELFKAHSGNAA